MLVATLRQDGKKNSEKEIPPYADILERMNREGLIERINLKRFKKADLKQLCRSLFPLADFSGEFYSLLFEVTNGVPLDTTKVIHYLITRKSRNIKELGGILDILDHASLELKRRITVPLIKMLEKEGTI